MHISATNLVVIYGFHCIIIYIVATNTIFGTWFQWYSPEPSTKFQDDSLGLLEVISKTHLKIMNVNFLVAGSPGLCLDCPPQSWQTRTANTAPCTAIIQQMATPRRKTITQSPRISEPNIISLCSTSFIISISQVHPTNFTTDLEASRFD